MSAASFLGIAGAIALFGYDGFLYSIGFLVAWLVALLLVAELLRNSGRYTMADVLAFRMRQRPVRTAAAISTVVVSIFYLLAQMVGAGALVALLLGVSSDRPAKNLTIVARRRADDRLRHGRRHEGHHLGADRQGRAADGGTALIIVLVLAKYNFNLSDLLGDRGRATAARAQAFLEPGLKYGVTDDVSKIDFLSLGIALVLGTAGLPHILIRFYTVPTARDARKSVLLGDRHHRRLLPVDPGARLRRRGAGRARATTAQVAASGGNPAAPLLAETVGGGAGIDRRRDPAGDHRRGRLRHHPRGGRRADPGLVAQRRARPLRQRAQGQGHREGRRSRSPGSPRSSSARSPSCSAIPAQNLNVAFLVALAFAVAASANLPAILYSLFWKRFNTRGAVWCIYGGLISSVGLVFFSPVVSGKGVDPVTGKNLSLLPTSIDFSWFPLENPGIISIPLGFLLGWLGTVPSREPDAEEVRRARGPLADRRRRREGRPALTPPPASAGRPRHPATPVAVPGDVRPRRRAMSTRGWREIPSRTATEFRSDRERETRPCPTSCTRTAASSRRPSSPRTPTSRRRPTTGPPPTARPSGPSRPSGSTGTQKWDRVLDWDNPPFAKWFVGGTLNAAYNCVDRHVEAGRGDKVAIHWVGEPEDDTRDLTYADLKDEVQQGRQRADRARRRGPATGSRSTCR